MLALVRRHGRVVVLIALLCALTLAMTGCGGPAEIESTYARPQATGVTAATANTPVAPSSPDRTILVALYNATNGANWYNNTNWLSDAPLGEWHGVITDQTDRVAELDLAHNRLAGAIPAELGSLASLSVLQLSGNKLTGEIPAELSELGDLKRLHLSGNQLTGEIPTELETLVYLTDFHLRGNTLTGCVPSKLYNVSSNDLGRLGLQPCVQASEPPDSIDRPALVALYHATDGPNWKNSRNWLSDVPLDKWRGVTTTLDGRVVEVSLSNNQLSGEIPGDLRSLAKLRVLSLGENRLTGAIPSELGELADLQVLDLGNEVVGHDENALTGTIPAELGNLVNLRSLNLSRNQLTGEIPAELGNLANLGRNPDPYTWDYCYSQGSHSFYGLDLSGNRLTGRIPAELGNLVHLGCMDLGNNQLTGQIPPELGKLTELRELWLGNAPELCALGLPATSVITS